VRFDEQAGCWEVFSYADVEQLTADTQRFSRDYLAGTTGLPWHPALDAMWAADPPRHTQLRQLAATPFSPATLRGLEDDIRAIAAELLPQRLATDATIDVLGFARSYSNRVICRMLDLPLEDDERIAGWVEEQIRAPSVFELPRQTAMIRYFSEFLRERRRNPRNGLVDSLLAAQDSGYEVAGKPMTLQTVLGYLWTLLVAGSETTPTSLGNALIAFIAGGHLEALRELRRRDDVRGTDRAIAEALRWNPAFPAVTVIANEKVAIGGALIDAGSWVKGWISAANRDPLKFADPQVFDIGREPNRHLSFSVGPHHCLGAPLARLEIRVAVETILDAVPQPVELDQESLRYSLGLVNSLCSATFRLSG